MRRVTLRPAGGAGLRAASRAGRRLSLRRRALQAGRILAVALPVAAAAAGAVHLWKAGWIAAQTGLAFHALLEATARTGLAVDDVLVAGRHNAPRESLLRALGVRHGSPILAVDPAAAKARLEALPWVRRAEVVRRLPSRLDVRIVERVPMALWQHQGQLAVVDLTGHVIERRDLRRFAGLPLIVGEGAPEAAQGMLEAIEAEPDMAARVIALVRYGDRRWNVRLDNGVDVKLPEDEPAEAWSLFARLERAHGLSRRAVVAIDLRFPDTLIVRLTPEAAERQRAPEQST